MIIQGKSDILVVTETKTDSTFLLNQFAIQGYLKPFKNRNGGGVFIYVREDIPSTDLKVHNTPQGIGSIFIKINLIKISGFFVAAIIHLATLTNTSLKIFGKR